MVTFARRSGTTVASLIPALVDLYAAVYTEPPYHEGPDEINGFRNKFPEETTRPGFSLIAAEDSGRLVGAAYGWTMAAGKWWGRADQAPAVLCRNKTEAGPSGLLILADAEKGSEPN